MRLLFVSSLLIVLVVAGIVKADISEETILRDSKGELAMGEYGSAIISFNRFLRNYPKSSLRPEAMYWRGVAFLSDSKKDSAKAHWELVPESDKRWFARANLSLAAVYADEKNWRSSNDALKKAMHAKDSSIISSILSQYRLNAITNGNKKEAEKLADSIVKFFPSSMEARILVESRNRVPGKPPQTVKQQDSVIVKNPTTGIDVIYALQLGAFQQENNASTFAESIKVRNNGKRKPEIARENRNGQYLYIVYVGAFEKESEARDYASEAGLDQREYRVVQRKKTE